MNTSKINVLLLCLLFTAFASAQQQSGPIVIQGATLINGTGSATIRNSAIVIDNGRIVDVGARNDVDRKSVV